MPGFNTNIILAVSAFTFSAGAATANAQDLLFEVPAIEASKLGWGRHTLPIKITNRSEYLKYVSILTDVKCRGENNAPERKVTLNYALFPGDTVNGEAVLLIPGNYGEFSFELKLYDVIDTLDQLLESQVIKKQSGVFTVPVTEAIAPYLNKEITLPPLVGRHVDFDNDFAHVLPFLIADGKTTLKEIADVAGCDTSFVSEEFGFMISTGYYRQDGSHYLSSIAAITEDEATEEKSLGLKVAESVAAQLKQNYQTYWKVIDSLVKAKALDADSHSFMDGGTILYRPYPVITALSLWYDLGSSFISSGVPFYLFDGSDFCNAYTPLYMYEVAGKKENNGQQLFAFMRSFSSYQICFGDTIPRIECPEGFMFSPEQGIRVAWEYERPYYPEGFMVDTTLVRPMLNHLRRGMDPILQDAFKKLDDLSHKYHKTFVLMGQRYWFWNIVTTRVVEILTENGTLTRRGNGQFRLDGMSLK